MVEARDEDLCDWKRFRAWIDDIDPGSPAKSQDRESDFSARDGQWVREPANREAAAPWEG